MEEPTEKRPLREITDEELKEILREHHLQAAFKNQVGVGKRANLTYVNLSNKDFYMTYLAGASLANARLWGTKFRAADLSGADLNSADVNGAIFDKANLQNATLDNIINLDKASLKNANLKGATGLKGTEFARADITGARLPDGIRDFAGLKTVEETSKNARKIFFSTLIACVYCWLTIGMTTDVNLLTNSDPILLPIIATPIPIAWFYLFAPVLLACLYFYLHFYLQRLWKSMAGLPAIFEDGKSLDERAYPWILNGLVRRHFERLKVKRTFLDAFEEIVSIFLAWWVVPLTLPWFWFRYIPRNEMSGTCLHVGIVAISIATGLIFYDIHASILRGKKLPPLTLMKYLRDKRVFKSISARISLLLLLILLFIVGINGRQSILYKSISMFGVDVSANLQRADFKNSDLEGVNFNNARLQSADLSSAVLIGAQLQRANLTSANLQGAILYVADLQGAVLSFAKLDSAVLSFAKLQGANLRSANLQGANLNEANLQGADLIRANLQGADLSLAKLDSANLRYANLQGAYLWKANLQGATLYRANLQDADLRDTDSLTQEQLNTACGDSLTILPESLTIPLCDTCDWYIERYGLKDSL